MTRPRALVLAPRGRDAAVAVQLLDGLDVEGDIAGSLEALVERLGDDVSLVLATEEGLLTSDLGGLEEWLKLQPAWSDLPLVVMTHAGAGPMNPQTGRLLAVLGNVTFLERPFRATTFNSLVAGAVSARRRQYDARARMDELAESQESVRTALLAGKLGTWQLHLADMLLEASPTCKAAFGRKADERFNYDDLVDSVHPDDRDRMREAVERSVHTGAEYEIEYRTIWPDGSSHWAEIHGRRIVGKDGRPLRMVGVSSDTTARKTAEQRLVAVNESLERRVAERTAALEDAHRRALSEIGQRERAEALLVQSQKVEAIGQLTGGVAHDFNNLLMAVLGNLEVLRRHVGSDDRATKLIDGALEGAQRGANLTQRLLAFARRQELALKPYDLGKLISALMPLIRQSAGPGVEIALNRSGRPAVAEVDVNQIELAVLNLVVNARDAMPDGGTIGITVGAVDVGGDETVLRPGRYLEIAVVDTGRGMDDETLRRAVEPFFSTKGVGKGTGLGLSMIHGLVEQLGGRLILSSVVGQGTQARILLRPAEKGLGDVSAPTVVTSLPAASPATNATVLVVDDDALIAMSTAAMVEDLGHHVIEAGSGSRALDILNTGRHIDLMITDFAMPRMNGAELIAAALKLRPDLPVILASGYAELPGGTRLDAARLAKPYDQKQLEKQINSALRK